MKTAMKMHLQAFSSATAKSKKCRNKQTVGLSNCFSSAGSQTLTHKTPKQYNYFQLYRHMRNSTE